MRARYLLHCRERLMRLSATPRHLRDFYSTHTYEKALPSNKKRSKVIALTGGAFAATIAAFTVSVRGENGETGEFEAELPTFSWQQIQEHSGGSKPAWVVYKHGVYDVTRFAGDHPGGVKVLQAAGKSIELFWLQSDPHTRAVVSEVLETLRIGNLRQQDVDMLEEAKQPRVEAATTLKDSDPSSVQLPLQRYFFVEGRPSPAPDVDAHDFKLKILGTNGSKDGEEMTLSLTDLKAKFKHHHVTTTIRCATPSASNIHNGKAESSRVPAKWTGVLLVDVLASFGIIATADIQQVRFEALDTDKQGRAFGSSLPAATALDIHAGVLLAYEMDGAPIPKEHGFPLRVIVPGTTGSRNVKFVHRIIITWT